MATVSLFPVTDTLTTDGPNRSTSGVKSGSPVTSGASAVDCWAVAAAVCWWVALFLLLAALTVESLSSAPGVMRAIVVVLASGVLGAGFFLAYARRPRAGSLVGLRRFNSVMLWLVVLGLGAYALVPRGGSVPQAVKPAEVVSVKVGVDEAQLAAAAKRTLTVEGMVCQSCVKTVTEALLGVPGVLAADVDLEGGRAVVSSTRDGTPPDSALVSALLAVGYKVWPVRAHGEDSEKKKVNDE